MLKKFLLLVVVVVVYVFVLFVFTVSVAGASTCRSSKIKHQFDVLQGYPHGRKGYVVDHWYSPPNPLFFLTISPHL
jgi:hypothetical protein